MSTFRVDTIKKHDQVSAVDLPNKLKIDGNKFEQGYTSSGTEPTNPDKGDIWWDSTNSKLYRYIAGEFKLLSSSVAPAANVFRGATQGVFNSGGTSENLTLAMPSGTQVGDVAIVVIGGLGWGNSGDVSIDNGSFGSATNYQWGYNSSVTTTYMVSRFVDTSISSTLLSSGVVISNNVSGTEYKLATLVVFSSGTSPLYSFSQINYSSQTNGTAYTQNSAPLPSGLAALSGGGIIEVQTTREGNRTYNTVANVSTLLSQVNRGTIYKHAVYQNHSSNSNGYGQPQHGWTYNGGTVYSAASLLIAY